MYRSRQSQNNKNENISIVRKLNTENKEIASKYK